MPENEKETDKSVSLSSGCAYTPVMVEATGFEPTTSWSRTKRATKLRYASVSLFIITNAAAFCKRFSRMFSRVCIFVEKFIKLRQKRLHFAAICCRIANALCRDV